MATNEERVDILEEIFQIIEEFSKEPMIKDLPEFEKRLKFLEESKMLIYCLQNRSFSPINYDGADLLQRFAAREGGDSEKAIIFCLLFTEDAEADSVCAYYAKRVIGTAYGSEGNIIIINLDCDETTTCIAACILHELGHAKLASEQGRVFKQNTLPDDKRMEEELELWEFDAKLAYLIGGTQYRYEFDLLARQLQLFWANIGKDINWTGKGKLLDFCFGEAETEAAKKQRDTTLSYYCYLLAANRYLIDADRAYIRSQIADGLILNRQKHQDLVERNS